MDSFDGTQSSSFSHPVELQSVPTNGGLTGGDTSSGPSDFQNLDPALWMSSELAQEGAHGSYKTNLGLLVDAMEETNETPGTNRAQHQQHPNPSVPPPAGNPRNSQQQAANQPGPAGGDARMRSLLAASMAVSPPGYSVSSTRTASLDQASAALNNDKGKRKREEDGQGDDGAAEAIRRRTGEVPRPRPGEVPAHSMTHVTCLHAAVAQKSYGHEKRFLCPPPLVRVITPMHAIKDQKFTMSVVTEDGIRLAEQVNSMDNIMQFKYLHVGGASSKSKSFHLTLDIAAPEPAPPHAPPGAAPGHRRWASFESGAITIISKPSKKTAKTRNVSTCIMNGSSVSLFNRINSQTVRTKYMTVDRAELAASNMSWSAFRIQILDDEAPPAGGDVGNQPGGAGAASGSRVGGMNLASTLHPQPAVAPNQQRPIHYGARVVLTDESTGISSEPLIIRKVDKGKLQKPEPNGGGGLVSQMQKIALQRASSNSDVPDVPNGLYLSAGRLPLPVHAADRSAVASSHSHSMGDGKTVSTAHPLTYQAPRGVGNVANADEVDDFLCWTIVGIAEYQYTFFDASTVHPPLGVPPTPVTPFPIAVQPPNYQIGSHRLDMHVLHFFPIDPRTGTPVGMEVWLGNLGPLPVHTVLAPPPPPNGMFPLTNPGGSYLPSPTVENGFVKQSPSGELAHIAPAPADGMIPIDGGDGTDNPPLPGNGRHTSLDPPGTRRTTESVMVLSVEMPPMTTILSAIREMTTPPPGAPQALAPNGGSAGPSNPAQQQQQFAGGVPVQQQQQQGAPGFPPGVQMQGPPQPVGRAALPIIFVRPYDLVGYMTGYSIACENVFSGNGIPTDPGLTGAQGWTVRVV